MTLVKALKQFFGMSGSDLIREFKDLTDQDKADFADMLAAELGEEISR